MAQRADDGMPIERLHEEFTRRIKTQASAAVCRYRRHAVLALLALGQINMRKVDGWQTLATKPTDQPFDLQ